MHAIIAILTAGLLWLGISLVLDSLERTERVLVRVEATLERACIQTCPDCPPFCAGAPGAYSPPKP